ncbi:MAG: 50S ribosomal protein L9, partial [Verrucomicrobia bacterium]
KALSKMTLVLNVKAGEEGKMFGSITAGTIADELRHQFEIAIDKKKIHLEHPLRTLGEHDVELRLHPEVTATLKVRAESPTTLSQPVEAPAAAPKSKEAAPQKGKEAASAKTGEAAPAKAAAKKERPPKKPKAEKKAE